MNTSKKHISNIEYRYLNNYNFVQKIRCLYKGNEQGFLELYFNPSINVGSTVYINCVGGPFLSLLEVPIFIEDVPAGYGSEEYNLTM